MPIWESVRGKGGLGTVWVWSCKQSEATQTVCSRDALCCRVSSRQVRFWWWKWHCSQQVKKGVDGAPWSFTLIQVLGIQYFHMGEWKQTSPAIHFAFPLTADVHPGHLHNVTHLWKHHNNVYSLTAPYTGINRLGLQGCHLIYWFCVPVYILYEFQHIRFHP